MADNLEIFGETYPNATGIKATDTNGVTQTFIKPSGTVSITSSGTTDVTAYASASVAAGTATAPASITGTSATVSTGTNTLTLSKTVSVTPSVTAGYISSGTAGNSSVSLTASVNTRSSSSLSADGATVTAPAGYYASDASKSVSTMTLPTSTSASATSGYTSKATVSRSTSDQYINIPTGYNSSGAYYKVNAVANGSATAPASISGSSATVSTGTNTLTLTKTVSVTPSVTAGYVSSGTAGNSSVSLTASVTTQAAQTIHPSTSDQSIAASRYLTGAQIIKGVLLTNLSAGNIKKDVVVKIGDSTDDDCVTSVTGTYSGGGGLKYEEGTFTLSADTQGNAIGGSGNTITHSLGVAPKVVFIWTEDYSAESPPAADLNFGYLYVVDIVDMQQQFSSSQFGDYPLYATFWMSAAGRVGVQNVTSTSYAPQVKPTSTEFYLYKRANNQYWRAGVTYHYFISEAWWTT